VCVITRVQALLAEIDAATLVAAPPALLAANAAAAEAIGTPSAVVTSSAGMCLSKKECV
jgi:hypothetical protein